MFFLDDGKALGDTFEKFEGKFKTTGGGYHQVEEMRAEVSKISLRRLKDHAVKLPRKKYIRIPTPMSPRQKVIYDTLRNELQIWVTSLSGEQVAKDAEAILARLTRLAQIASNPRLLDAAYVEVPGKFRALDKILSDLFKKPDQKVIVWSSFVENISELRQRYSSRTLQLYSMAK